jgi:phosphatidylserine/phosphatidylglycerophosphate/cardiolipin synthase-like enzyme
VDVAAPGEEPTPAGTHRCASTLYVHAKAMVLWRQGAPVAAFLGSENLSATSLDHNREIGVVLAPDGARQIADALQPVLTCG